MKKFSLWGTLALSLATFVSPAVIANDLTAEENDMIVKEDVASAQVMIEVCPSIIGQNAKFDTTIQQLIQSYLKEYSDKSMTYQKLQADSEYKTVLEEARQGANRLQKTNKTACEDVLAYQE